MSIAWRRVTGRKRTSRWLSAAVATFVLAGVISYAASYWVLQSVDGFACWTDQQRAEFAACDAHYMQLHAAYVQEIRSRLQHGRPPMKVMPQALQRAADAIEVQLAVRSHAIATPDRYAARLRLFAMGLWLGAVATSACSIALRKLRRVFSRHQRSSQHQVGLERSNAALVG